ncbi:hypothetical protein, partial [Lactobacillus crispatus]|uniref:hypothetical protein n=1 Tax=Lactobacillus crispatus TaxID=47770 RepID=UPI001F098199
TNKLRDQSPLPYRFGYIPNISSEGIQPPHVTNLVSDIPYLWFLVLATFSSKNSKAPSRNC